MTHRHITKRAFKAKCRDCGKPVLFWECADCGAKAFFSLPIYGKPIRHLCEKYLKNKGKNLPPWRTEKEIKLQNPLEIIKVMSFSCPVCDKLFDSEKDLNNHINNLKKNDDEHGNFFNKVLDMINFSENESKSDFEIRGDKMGNKDSTNFDSVGPYGFRIKRKKKKD